MGDELLLKTQDALLFIQDCMDMGLFILGLDFYKEEDDNIIEVASADYSSLIKEHGNVMLSISAARQLIQDGLPDGATWVSFVVQERQKSTN